MSDIGAVAGSEPEPGVSVWTMSARTEADDPAEWVPGGRISALADAAMSAAAQSRRPDGANQPAGAELHLSFARPARTDEVLTCTARVVNAGRRITFVEADVTDGAGNLIAKASSTFLT